MPKKQLDTTYEYGWVVDLDDDVDDAYEGRRVYPVAVVTPRDDNDNDLTREIVCERGPAANTAESPDEQAMRSARERAYYFLVAASGKRYCVLGETFFATEEEAVARVARLLRERIDWLQVRLYRLERWREHRDLMAAASLATAGVIACSAVHSPATYYVEPEHIKGADK